MLTESTRQFDLYDFFSVLIPGAAFLIGVAPFLPNQAVSFSVPSVIVLIILGFVFGRFIHASGLLLERFFGATSNRDYFISELENPSSTSPSLVDEFYRCAQDAFPSVDIPDERSELKEKDFSDELEQLYVLVRSYIHMDARGRSRTFQAVLDFYRGIWVGSLFLVIIYVAYVVIVVLGWNSREIIGYQSYLGALDIHFAIIFFAAVFVLGGAYATFEQVRSDYRAYFVQYLFSDFVVLRDEIENKNSQSR
jgi:hypothetical protein